MLYSPRENGQALVDYSLIILLIALIVIAVLALFGQQLVTFISLITNSSAWPR